jgi:DNA-binding response OmpR family regulator
MRILLVEDEWSFATAVRRGLEAEGFVVELEAGDLELDPASHRLWRGSVEIELTAREFALLELLMRHRGEVLTRREILDLDEAWDFGFDSDSNIVEVYVGYLRRAGSNRCRTADPAPTTRPWRSPGSSGCVPGRPHRRLPPSPAAPPPWPADPTCR